MAISYTFAVKGKRLLVTTSGVDENLAEVQAYGMALIEAAAQNDATSALIDERGLIYRLTTVDSFISAEFIATSLPAVAKVAIVTSPANVDDAAFWETVAVNRGLTLRFFQDMDAAELWLDEA
jgi:acetylglutamate synthase